MESETFYLLSITLLVLLKESERIYLKKFSSDAFSSRLLDVQLLHAHVLGLKREDLILQEERLLTSKELESLNSLCNRRLQFEPIAYILGKKEFYSLDFFVGNGVLIPRPETEELVELIIDHYKKSNLYRMLDLCCGSGCIGVALGRHLNCDEYFFVDKSKIALDFTEKNIQKHLSHIQDSVISIIRSDLCEKLLNKGFESSFDMIVSNPPYLNSSEIKLLDRDVQDYEPLLALQIPNNDETLFFRRLFLEVYFLLKKEGCFFLETSPILAIEQRSILKEIGFNEVSILKDLSLKDRFIVCSKS